PILFPAGLRSIWWEGDQVNHGIRYDETESINGAVAFRESDRSSQLRSAGFRCAPRSACGLPRIPCPAARRAYFAAARADCPPRFRPGRGARRQTSRLPTALGSHYELLAY